MPGDLKPEGDADASLHDLVGSGKLLFAETTLGDDDNKGDVTTSSPRDEGTAKSRGRDELVNMKEEVFDRTKATYRPVVHSISLKPSRMLFTSNSQSSNPKNSEEAESLLLEVENAYFGKDREGATRLATSLFGRKDVRIKRSDRAELEYLQKQSGA